MTLDAHTLPWYLVGVLVTALMAVFYAQLRGKIMSRYVSDLLRDSAEKRAEAAEAAAVANTKAIESLTDSVAKLTVYAENADKVLRTLASRVDRGEAEARGGAS